MREACRLLRLPWELRRLIYDLVFSDRYAYIHCLRYIYYDLNTRRQVPGALLVNRQLHNDFMSYLFDRNFVALIRGPNFPVVETYRSKASVTMGLRILSAILRSIRHLTLVILLDDRASSIFLLSLFRFHINARTQPLKSLKLKFEQNILWPGVPDVNIECQRLVEKTRILYTEVILAARDFRCAKSPIFQFPPGLEANCFDACEMLKSSYDNCGAMTKSINSQLAALSFTDERAIRDEALATFYRPPGSLTPSGRPFVARFGRNETAKGTRWPWAQGRPDIQEREQRAQRLDVRLLTGLRAMFRRAGLSAPVEAAALDEGADW